MMMWVILLLPASHGQFRGVPESGKDADIFFSRLSRENGLPTDFILHGVQDFRGYIWFATNNGLCRFDGKNYTTFRNHPGKVNSIVDNYVIFLHESADSMLWIGTRLGVSVYNPFTAAFRNYRYHPHKRGYFPCRFVREIMEDEHHNLWFACNDGLVYLQHGSSRFEKITLKRPRNRHEPEADFNYVTCFAGDQRAPGHMFLGTYAGVVLFDVRNRRIVEDYPLNIKGHQAVYDLFTDEDQQLWAGGWFIGLNCLDPESHQWKECPLGADKVLTVLDINPKNRDELWLATIGNGIGIYNKKTCRYRFIRHEPLNTNSLISDNVNHLGFFNRSRDLWAFSSEGVSVENRNIHVFKKMYPPYKFNAVTDIYHDSGRHHLYAGSYPGDGLMMFDEFTSRWSLIRPENRVQKGGFVVNQFLCDPNGILWMGTDDNLYYLDPVDRKLRLWQSADHQPLQFKSPMIISVSRDYTGNLWLGTRYDGIAKLDPVKKTVRYYHHAANDPFSVNEGPIYRCIRTDRNNKTWICSQGGISMYDPVKDRFDNSLMDTMEQHGLSPKQVYNLEFDSLDRMWLTIDGSGLARVSRGTSGNYEFRFFDSSEGFDASSISVMRQDTEGDFWINNVSLIRFNPYTERFHLYDTHNGLRDALVIGQKIHVDNDLTVFLAGEEGISYKNKHSEPPSNGIVNLIIEGIEINGEYNTPGYHKHTIPEYRLPASMNNITFFYTAVCYDNQADIKYMYKLEGYDKEWYQAGSSREARYTNLPPGEYIFRFKVLNQPEPDQSQNHVVVLIRQVFWKSWWFALLLILTVSSLSYVFYMYRLRQLLRIEQVRMRIASDLHDDVGSTLSSFSILSDVLSHQVQDGQAKKMLRSIGESSSLMVEKLDDIVWMVNPKNDRFEDLGLRISEFATPLIESRQLAWEYYFDPALSGMRLLMETRRNIYLIAKEAINNSLKYSSCNKITVEFLEHNNHLVMQITDDGIGFDPESPTSRNGLKNMISRAEQIRASLEIESGEGKGTRVKLMVGMKSYS